MNSEFQSGRERGETQSAGRRRGRGDAEGGEAQSTASPSGPSKPSRLSKPSGLWPAGEPGEAAGQAMPSALRTPEASAAHWPGPGLEAVANLSTRPHFGD
ncbi:hypothetical protein P7K49_035539 [Saguinus oedipus]|uniref:Uncharacterized protein n=1 Tax=Saguinus oedipus TaxID=9490 RepID=A0ABQ9TMW7_SAGOE|nr:hypothetical protein P7K49_035539 [Saguinus oedipus]